MIGTKELCALLLAGGIGAGSAVTVQHARPAISKPKPKLAKVPRPKPQVAARSAAPRPALGDCPVSAASLGDGRTDLALLPSEGLFALQPAYSDSGGGIGGGGGGGYGPSVQPGPIPVGPGVPQPDTWVMMVAGFGFLGLAARRSRRAGDRRFSKERNYAKPKRYAAFRTVWLSK